MHRNEEPGSCSTRSPRVGNRYHGSLYSWSVNSHIGLSCCIFAVFVFSIHVFKQLSARDPSEQTRQQLLYQIEFLVGIYSFFFPRYFPTLLLSQQSRAEGTSLRTAV